jgi:hypothetical protein
MMYVALPQSFWDQLLKWFTNQLFVSVSKHFFRVPVHYNDSALPICKNHGIRHGFKQPGGIDVSQRLMG